MKPARRKPWWYRPSAPVREQHLTRRRIYILPTRSGLLLALVLMAMLLGAINYNNSLVYGLTFLIAGVGVISMIHTYRNLAGLTVRTGQCRPVFAGDTALFPVAVENRGIERFAVSLELESGQAMCDLREESLHWIELRHPVAERGWAPLPRVTAATTFPLGLFRAWSYLELDQRCLVYPRPEEASPPLPSHAGNHAGEEKVRSGQGREDFSSLRDYRAGDSLRHVHWKALAREQGLLTKEFEGGGATELWLEWEGLQGLSAEARLARLCRWVLMADQSGQRYGLALPGLRVAANRGGHHRQRCLEALALFGIGNE